MKSENYFDKSEKSTGDISYYGQQLLLNDDYLDSAFQNALKASNHFNLELGDLEEDLEDDLYSEYDENDWEEDELDDEAV
ncbi:hypothetical protein [Flavobacterium sp. 3-210]